MPNVQEADNENEAAKKFSTCKQRPREPHVMKNRHAVHSKLFQAPNFLKTANAAALKLLFTEALGSTRLVLVLEIFVRPSERPAVLLVNSRFICQASMPVLAHLYLHAAAPLPPFPAVPLLLLGHCQLMSSHCAGCHAFPADPDLASSELIRAGGRRCLVPPATLPRHSRGQAG